MTDPMTPTEQDKEQRYHLASCEMYETLRGIFPNDRRLTGKSCSCGLKELITADRKRVALEARLDELRRASDMQYIMRRADRVSYCSDRLIELRSSNHIGGEK